MKFKSDIEVQAGLKDSSGSNGTSGQILSSNGTTVSWVPPGTSYTSDVQNEVKAGVAIGKGQAVYVTSADGTNIIVGLASNTTEATSSKTLGLLDATVAINGFANVVQIGRLEGLNTSTAVVGDPVWLGTSGNLIYGLANKPYAPAHLVYIGVVTRVNANNGEIFINVQNGFELKEIHDVDIVSTAPVGNDILAFEGAPVNLWKNKTIPAVLGYTPADQAITISTTAPLSGGGNLSANRTLSIVQANATTNGYLSSADWTTFNNKQNALNGTGFVKISGTTISYDNSTYVPTSRTITINGVGYDLSADRSWTVSGGIGGSGDLNRVPKFTASTTIGNSSISDDGTIVSLLNADSRLYGGSNTGRFIIGNPSVTTYAAIYGNSHATAPSLFQIVANNIAALSIPASGNVGIGTVVPINGGSAAKWVTAEGTTTYGGGFISSVNGNAKGYFYSQDGYAILQGAPSQGVKLMPNGVDGITVFSAGNVFIGTSPTDAGYKLNVSGDFLASGFTKSYTGNVNSDNYFEKVFSNAISFPNGSANLAADVRFGNTSFWGYIEVEVTATYSNQNSAGKLTKVFAVGTNPNNLIYTNESRVVDSMGTISDNIAIGDFSWDGTNSTYKIPISHIVSSGNLYTVKVRMFTHGSGAWTAFNAITISNNYSLTALPRQYPYYNDRLGVGTTTPSVRFNVVSNEAYNWTSTMSSSLTSGHNLYFGYNNNVNTTYGLLITGGRSLANQIDLGVENKFYVNGNGNVLIGTTTDSGYKLDVNGTGRFTGQLNVDYRLYLPNLMMGYWDGVNNRIESTTRPLFITSYSQPIRMGISGNNNLTINTSGFVGVNIDTPTAQFQVDKGGWATNNAAVSRMLQKYVGYAGDYEQHVILLHPIYNGTLIGYNKCSGTIFASRGGTAQGLINDNYNLDTSSAYNSFNGTINSTIGYGRLYTCLYNGVKYMALLPDYRTSAVEYNFDGYTKSTGEQLKIVTYRMSNTGTIVNSEVYNSLTVYGSGITYYQGDIYSAGTITTSTVAANSMTANTFTASPTSGQIGFLAVTTSTTPSIVNQMAAGLNAGVGVRLGGSNGNAYGSTSLEVTTSNYGAGIKIITGVYSASQQAIQFTSNTTTVGSITCTTTATTYSTSSDYRLKENIEPMSSSIVRLKALKPYKFNFINEPNRIVDGFVAHEVQEIVPEAVTGEKDYVNPIGEPVYQGIDQSKIVPLLTAALQEAISKIEELENRLSILENN